MELTFKLRAQKNQVERLVKEKSAENMDMHCPGARIQSIPDRCGGSRSWTYPMPSENGDLEPRVRNLLMHQMHIDAKFLV
jgi:hypothetical protein